MVEFALENTNQLIDVPRYQATRELTAPMQEELPSVRTCSITWPRVTDLVNSLHMDSLAAGTASLLRRDVPQESSVISAHE